MTHPSDPWWQVAEWNGIDPPDDGMSIGFTGTRRGMTTFQKESVRQLLKEIRPRYLVHGDCLGADADFDALAHETSPEAHFTVRPGHDKSGMSPHRAHCPADIIYPAEPYHERNRKIVEGTRVLIATPEGPERKHSGTWYTVRFARELATKTIYVVMPDGAIEVEEPASVSHVLVRGFPTAS